MKKYGETYKYSEGLSKYEEHWDLCDKEIFILMGECAISMKSKAELGRKLEILNIS